MPYENNEEERSERKELKKDEDENDVDDKNDDGKKEISNGNKNERDLSFSYHHQSGAIHTVDNIGNFSESSTVSSKSGSGTNINVK